MAVAVVDGEPAEVGDPAEVGVLVVAVLSVAVAHPTVPVVLERPLDLVVLHDVDEYWKPQLSAACAYRASSLVLN